MDKLVEAKIPKSTATELVDRIDRGNLEPDNPKWINLENDVQDLKSDVQDIKSDVQVLKNEVQWLKWVVALGFSALIALMFGIVGIVTYLHNDMKAEIHSVRTEMKTEMQSLRTEMQSMQKEINAKIDQILLQRR